MPLNIDIVQILLHMLNFAILAGGLTLLLFSPVSKFLEERRRHFEELERENAEKAAEAERLREEYERKLAEAGDEIDRMRAEAEKEAAETARRYLDSAKEKAGELVSGAEAEAEARKAQILESAQTEISELVLTAAQKLISSSGDEEHTRALYDAFLEEAAGEERASAERSDGR
jgi:F-type H+-transporting ATPase subunit b